MKKQSRTVPRRRQSVSPTPRHLPLVDILIDTQAELQALVVASGLKVLEAMLEEDRAAVCGPRYAHQPARQAYRTGHTPSQVVLGGRKVAIRRPRARRAGEEVPLPTARAFANADPLNRRVVDQMLIGVATRQHPHKNGPRRGAPAGRLAGLVGLLGGQGRQGVPGLGRERRRRPRLLARAPPARQADGQASPG